MTILDQSQTNKQTSLLADSRVNRSAKQVKDEARQMTVISGLKCLELYNLQNRHGSSLRMLMASLLGTKAWYSNKSALIWKVKVTKSNRLLFQLSPRMHRTKGT